MCCLLLAALGAARGQDAPKPADQSAAPEGGGQPDQTLTMPNPSPQATKKSPTPEHPSDASGRITVQLIQVRSDWSKGKDPVGTKKTLETVLKDVALPENYRSNLLGSASRILFPEDFAGGYRPEQLASLLAWMKQRDLVRIDLPPKPLLPDLPHEGRSSLSPGTCRLFAGEDIVPVSATRERLDPPPFFKRTYGWEWHCMSRLQTDGTMDQAILELGIQRFRAFRDDPQVDGQSPRLTAASDGTPIGITLPFNWAGVVRCFGPGDEMSEQIQLQDWEPLLVIAYGAAETHEIETPKLAAPASLLELGEPRVLASKKLAEVFQLANTQATELGPLLQGVISNGRLVADKDKNSLLAYGTQTELDTLKALLAKLDAAPTAPPYSSGPERAAPPAPAAEADQQVDQVAVFHLKHADLSQVIRALAAVSSGLRAEVDDLGGSLTVMGTKDDLAAVRDLIAALDQPTTPDSYPPPSTRDQRQIKIFNLVHARANQMTAILRQLFPEITMSGDDRTNSLIAQGEQGRLEAAEAVIQKLDETPSEKQEPPLDEASRRRILETASGEFAVAEAEIQSIVESIAGEADKKKAEQLRARLAGLVAEAFDLRQKLQRAELALLKERVGIIESRLGQREALRDEIIKRRVKSLLAGGMPSGGESTVAPKGLSHGMVSMGFRNQPWADVLEWLAGVLGAKLQVDDTMPEGTFDYTSPKAMSLEEAREIIRAALRPKGYVINEHDDGKTHLLLVSLSYEEWWRRRAVEAQEEVAKWRLALEDEESKNDAGYRAALETRLQAAQNALATLQSIVAQELSNKTAGYQKAESSLQAARQSWEDLKKLRAKGHVTQEEVDAAEKHLQRLNETFESARAVLEALREAAETAGLSPAAIKKAEAAAEDIARQSREEPSGTPQKNTLQGAASQVSETSIATRPALTGTALPLRSPEEFALAAREAVVELRRASTMKVRERRENEDPAEYEKFVASQRKDPLAWAQRRLNLVREEFAAQVHLLELEVRTTEAAAATAQEELQRLTSLFKSGAAPASEVSDAKLKAEQASVRLEQAKTLLQLYLKAGENPDLKGSDSAPVGKEAKEPPATSEGTSLPPQRTVAAAAAPASRLALRTPEEFQRMTNEARDDITRFQNAIEQGRTLRPEWKKEDLPRLESSLRDVETKLTSARQRLELIQAEYAAQIRLLENELASAKSRLSFAQQAVYRDARTGAERTKMAQDREQAKSQCEQAQILLDLYRKAGEKADLNPNDANPLKDSSKSNDAPADTAPLPKAQTVPNGASDGKIKSSQ